jgi:DNA polymerase IIIc chi subunit
MKTKQDFYVNLDTSDRTKEIDKFLWVREKNNFLPHKVLGENITAWDKVVLFDGDYNKLDLIKSFQTIIISPYVYVKKFNLFKKFLIFSFANENLYELKKRKELENSGYIVNCYDEYQPFKWKTL